MRAEAARAYQALAAQARLPRFYTSFGVPDSVDGRFEMLCVHAHALFHRLRGQGAKADEMAQAVYDAMFADLDASLREMGAADLGVGRRIKVMTEALKGRIQAYDSALEQDQAALGEAVARNVYGTTAASPAQVAGMARYLRDLRADLAQQDLSALLAGEVRFPTPVEEARDAG